MAADSFTYSARFTTNTLNRLLRPAAHARLQALIAGRRNIVWTLEHLLERRETFFDAAYLLRRLAEAENEHFGNNATGVWKSIFLTFLGPTEVPSKERYQLIRDALLEPSEAARVLAVEGVGSALQGSEFGSA